METLGGSTETWGNSLTDTWVNDADFGVAIGVLQDSNNQDVYLDYIAVDVYYTAGGAAGRRRMIFMQ